MAGTVNFNEASGQKLGPSTFEGKSQGLSWGIGAAGWSYVKSYVNGQWNTNGSNNSGTLYTAKLGGFGVGSEVGVQYSFTESKLISQWSIPFKK